MKTSSLLVATFAIFIPATYASFDDALIMDYLKINNLKTVLFMDCKQIPYAVETSKYFQNHGIWISFWDMSQISDLDYNQFFIRTTHPICTVFKLECNNTLQFLNELSKRTMFHMERFFLVFSSTLKVAYDKLSWQNINFDAEITLVTSNTKQDYTVYEVYNPSFIRHGRFNITKIAYWNQKTSLKSFTNQTKFERRHSFGGITFQSVVVLTNIPKNRTFLEHLESDEFVYLDSMTRYLYRLFQLIMEIFNFKSYYHIANSWGVLDLNGTWHGAVGVMKRKEVDFATTGFRRENERYGALEILSETKFVQVLKFIFRHPKSIDAAGVFLAPFQYSVWNIIAIVAVLFIIILKNLYSFETRISAVKASSENSYSCSFLTVSGIICQQVPFTKPQFLSSRVLTFTMLVYSLFIYQFYSSFVVGSLLTEGPKTIKTMKQLIHSNLEMGMDQVPYVRDVFKRVKDEPSVRLYKKLIDNQDRTIMPLQKGLDLVKKGGFAFNTDVISAYNILKDMLDDNEKCEMQEISYIEEIPISAGVPYKSPLREMIKISIRRFSETGIISYHLKDWLGTRSKCNSNRVILAPVDIDHLSAALYLLLIGSLVSIAIFFIENFVARFKIATLLILNKRP